MPFPITQEFRPYHFQRAWQRTPRPPAPTTLNQPLLPPGEILNPAPFWMNQDYISHKSQGWDTSHKPLPPPSSLPFSHRGRSVYPQFCSTCTMVRLPAALVPATPPSWRNEPASVSPIRSPRSSPRPCPGAPDGGGRWGLRTAGFVSRLSWPRQEAQAARFGRLGVWTPGGGQGQGRPCWGKGV